MKKRSLIWIILIAAIIIGYFILSGGNTGTLKLQITDAPAGVEISKALVTISNIEVHLSPGSANTTKNESTGWFSIIENPVEYDLIEIKDIKEILGEKEITPGKYTQIRLSVNKALVTIDGKGYNLNIPSKEVKLTHNFDIIQGETTTLTLDFDAQESIKSTGKDTYIMNPTIRIIQE